MVEQTNNAIPTQAEIKKLRDNSELAQVYTSLNRELESVREHFKSAEVKGLNPFIQCPLILTYP